MRDPFGHDPDWSAAAFEALVHTALAAACLFGGYLAGSVIGAVATELGRLAGWIP